MPLHHRLLLRQPPVPSTPSAPAPSAVPTSSRWIAVSHRQAKFLFSSCSLQRRLPFAGPPIPSDVAAQSPPILSDRHAKVLMSPSFCGCCSFRRRLFFYASTITDPVLWRGLISAKEIVLMLKDFEIPRQHYYPSILLMAIYETSYFQGLVGYFHITCNRSTGRIGVQEIRRIAHQRANAHPSIVFGHGSWLIRVFVIEDLPITLEATRYVGPWIVNVRHRVVRALQFEG
ncbi:hypothetical protein L7F22_055918 [Adiantum nelumboides]|nr:hypothetical protein [Adiantum nelumboides]